MKTSEMMDWYVERCRDPEFAKLDRSGAFEALFSKMMETPAFAQKMDHVKREIVHAWLCHDTSDCEHVNYDRLLFLCRAPSNDEAP